jgi:CO dehydrogenase nickel-insertion accessory protein CooC1
LLGELEGEGRFVIGDLEAGTGTLLRLLPGQVDAVLVVAQPAAKAMEVTRRAARIAENRGARVYVVANRVRDDDELAAVRTAAGEHELVVVPEDPAVLAADRDGLAPLDVAPDSPAARALIALAELLAGPRPPRSSAAGSRTSSSA